MKTDLFLPCGHYLVFQICWHIEYSTLTALSFNIWNSSAGIPSPPLALQCFLRPTWAGSDNVYSSNWRVTLLQGSQGNLGCLWGAVQVCSVCVCVPLGAGLVQPTPFHSSPRKESNTIIDCTCKVISTLFGLSQAKCLDSYHHLFRSFSKALFER